MENAALFCIPLSVPGARVAGMALHRVSIDTAWRPDFRGQRRRRHLAHCLCGWSTGWIDTRHEAAGAGDDHRSAAALAARMARR